VGFRKRAGWPFHMLRLGWRHLPGPVRAPFHVAARTIQLYVDDSCSTYAAAIAYYSIFALVPLALVILSIVGLVVQQQRIVNMVFDQLPLKDTAAVRQNVEAIVSRAHQISVAGLSFGLVALVWSASGIFTAVRNGLNATRRRRRGRPYWRSKLLDITLIPCLGLLILVSVGLTAGAQILIDGFGSLGPLNLDKNIPLRTTSYALPLMVSFVSFALLYRFVPASRPSWGEACTGAALASALFELVKNLYAVIFSLTSFSKDTAIYAGFGTALGFLLWLFIDASVLLLGAEFGRAVKLARRGLVIEPEDRAAAVTPTRPPSKSTV